MASELNAPFLPGPYTQGNCPVTGVMKHLGACERSDIFINLGGLIAGDIAEIHTSGAVIDDNN